MQEGLSMKTSQPVRFLILGALSALAYQAAAEEAAPDFTIRVTPEILSQTKKVIQCAQSLSQAYGVAREAGFGQKKIMQDIQEMMERTYPPEGPSTDPLPAPQKSVPPPPTDLKYLSIRYEKTARPQHTQAQLVADKSLVEQITEQARASFDKYNPGYSEKIKNYITAQGELNDLLAPEIERSFREYGDPQEDNPSKVRATLLKLTVSTEKLAAQMSGQMNGQKQSAENLYIQTLAVINLGEQLKQTPFGQQIADFDNMQFQDTLETTLTLLTNRIQALNVFRAMTIRSQLTSVRAISFQLMR